MKRLSIEKLKCIIRDFEKNKINFIDKDQMSKLYDSYGDTIYYNRDYGIFEVVEKGNGYIELKERK